jgi:hypothetical protein
VPSGGGRWRGCRGWVWPQCVVAVVSHREVQRLGAPCSDVRPTGRRCCPAAAIQPIPSPTAPRCAVLLLHAALPLRTPVMSGQQCLRRLPCAVRSVPALRAGARGLARLPAARGYSAVTKATCSGLLSQVARWVLPPQAAVFHADSPTGALDRPSRNGNGASNKHEATVRSHPPR